MSEFIMLVDFAPTLRPTDLDWSQFNKREREASEKERKKNFLLPSEKNVNISMKASDTWSHCSHSLIAESFVVRVVEVGCGIKICWVGMWIWIGICRREWTPSVVCRVAALCCMSDSKLNRCSLLRHFNYFVQCKI